MLEIRGLLKQIESELIKNIDDLDFFSVFNISRKFNFKKLEAKCVKELHLFKFEQLNFNRYDLLQCEKDTFLAVLSLYNDFRNNVSKKCPKKAIAK